MTETLAERPTWQRDDERIKQLMQDVGYPNSMSLYQAFKQFANELRSESSLSARGPSAEADGMVLVPREPTEAEIEAGCRALHEEQGTGDADAPLHSPYQNSWDEPDRVRWKQWEDTVRQVRAAMIAAGEKPAAPAGPVAYIDSTGKVSLVEGSPLPELVRALPEPPMGKKVLPLYAAPASELAELRAEVERLECSLAEVTEHNNVVTEKYKRLVHVTGPAIIAKMEAAEARLMEATMTELRALIDDMREGLAKLPKGPWETYGKDPAREIGATVTAAFCEVSGGFPVLADIPPRTAGWTSEEMAAHIARCSPENIAKLLTAAEQALSAPPQTEPVAVPAVTDDFVNRLSSAIAEEYGGGWELAETIVVRAMRPNEIAALSSTPAAPAAVPAWQTMDSAPKDGTLVILCFDHHPVTIGRFEYGTWVYAFCLTEGGDSPTGWQPLPAAPLPSQPAEGGRDA